MPIVAPEQCYTSSNMYVYLVWLARPSLTNAGGVIWTYIYILYTNFAVEDSSIIVLLEHLVLYSMLHELHASQLII